MSKVGCFASLSTVTSSWGPESSIGLMSEKVPSLPGPLGEASPLSWIPLSRLQLQEYVCFSLTLEA